MHIQFLLWLNVDVNMDHTRNNLYLYYYNQYYYHQLLLKMNSLTLYLPMTEIHLEFLLLFFFFLCFCKH